MFPTSFSVRNLVPGILKWPWWLLNIESLVVLCFSLFSYFSTSLCLLNMNYVYTVLILFNENYSSSFDPQIKKKNRG